MKAESTIRVELRRVEAAQKLGNLTDESRDELYGAAQALAWALGHDAMAPAKSATFGITWHYGESGREVRLSPTSHPHKDEVPA